MKIAKALHTSKLSPNLEHLLIQISKSFQQNDDDSRICTLELINAAIMHHAFSGGLSDHVMNKLQEIATAFFKCLKLNKRAKYLRQLELRYYLALSQVARADGDYVGSAIELFRARMSDPTISSYRSYEDLSLANRYQRLGLMPQALSLYQQVIQNSADPLMRERSWLEMIRVQRFLRIPLAAEIDFDQVFKSEKFKVEMKWEIATRITLEKGNAHPLLRLAMELYRLNHPIYSLEAILWIKAFNQLSLLNRLNCHSTISRKIAVPAKNQWRLTKFVRLLDDCDASNLPLNLKLTNIEQCLEKSSKLPGIDQELLVLAVTARVSKKIRCEMLREIAMSKYRSLSYKMSNHSTNDVFGFFKN